MADRYWVSNSGNTNDTAHWSLTSGGAGGASVPTSADRALFDANSFTLTGQTVTVNVAFDCLDMDWTGATNNPTFAINTNLTFYGSHKFISGMTVTGTGTVVFGATATGKTITMAGKSFGNAVQFNSVSGGWIFQDSFSAGGNIVLLAGALDTNSKAVSCATFNSSGSSTRSLTLGSSVITCTAWTFTTTTGLTFSGGSCTINMIGSGPFAGGGLTYNIVNFSGTTMTVTGSNTITTVTIAAGKTLKLTSGTTQTITTLICNGTTALPSTLQSVTAASAATITLPAGRYFIRHTSIQDITISGATAVTSIAGTNVSGNTGITFVTKFEMGRIKNDGSFNWYSTATGTVVKVSG